MDVRDRMMTDHAFSLGNEQQVQKTRENELCQLRYQHRAVNHINNGRYTNVTYDSILQQLWIDDLSDDREWRDVQIVTDDRMPGQRI